MLVLTLKIGEQVRVGDDVTITVIETRRRSNQACRIGVEAPTSTKVRRAGGSGDAPEPNPPQEPPDEN